MSASCRAGALTSLLSRLLAAKFPDGASLVLLKQNTTTAALEATGPTLTTGFAVGEPRRPILGALPLTFIILEQTGLTDSVMNKVVALRLDGKDYQVSPGKKSIGSPVYWTFIAEGLNG